MKRPDYKPKILMTLNRPYVEFWKVVVRTGQTTKPRQFEHILYVLEDIVELLKQRKIYIKYQVYDRETFQLLGFFDPSRVYRGFSYGNKYYRQTDTINVLVLTKIPGDMYYKPSLVKTGSIVRSDLKKKLSPYERYM